MVQIHYFINSQRDWGLLKELLYLYVYHSAVSIHIASRYNVPTVIFGDVSSYLGRAEMDNYNLSNGEEDHREKTSMI